MRTFSFILIFLFFAEPGLKLFAQQRHTDIDSFKVILGKKKMHDTLRCVYLSAISDRYFVVDSDSALRYSHLAANLAESNLAKPGVSHKIKHSFETTIGAVYSNLASLYEERGENDKIFIYHEKSLKIFIDLNDPYGLGAVYNKMGLSYDYQGRLDLAVEYYMKGLRLREKIKDKKGVAQSLNNLAYVHNIIGNRRKSLEYYEKALAMRRELKDSVGLGYSLNDLSITYQDSGLYEKAYSMLKECIMVREKSGDLTGMGSSYSNMAVLLNKMKKFDSALYFGKQSLFLREKTKSKSGGIQALNSVAAANYWLKNYTEALRYAEKSYKLALELGYPEHVRSTSRLLWTIYKAMGQPTKAIKMYELYVKMKDSLDSQNGRKLLYRNQLHYDYEKKSAADSAKNAEEQKVKDALFKVQKAQIAHDKFQGYFLLGGLALVFLGLLFGINRFRVAQKQKKVIEKQKVVVDEAFDKLHERNKDVMDSIYYAQKIQNALLTSEMYIQRKLDEHLKK